MKDLSNLNKPIYSIIVSAILALFIAILGWTANQIYSLKNTQIEIYTNQNLQTRLIKNLNEKYDKINEKMIEAREDLSLIKVNIQILSSEEINKRVRELEERIQCLQMKLENENIEC